MENFNLENDLHINPDALDVEWLRQASLFARYSEEEAAAKKKVSEAHEKLKVVRSQLVKEAAEDKTLSNAQKVEAWYRDHPRHQEAKEEMIQAEYESSLLSTAVYAFHQRKTTLENLTRLCLAGYFNGPTAPRDLADEYEKAVDQRTDRVRKKTQRRMK